MHGPTRTSTATNGTLSSTLSRANQKTIPTHIPKPQTYKSHLVSSNLVSGITSHSTNHSFFTPPGKESEQHHNDLKTCQVRSGGETAIEIVKEKLGLGLSIVGGSDTPLVSLLLIFRLFMAFNEFFRLNRTQLLFMRYILTARQHSTDA